jgi:DNA-binding XRE family transcriptional regulator
MASYVIYWHDVVIPRHDVVYTVVAMRKKAAGFGLALQGVRSALRLSQDAFGARLGVSRRTLTRWEIHDELPPVGQRKHIATSFPDVPFELRAALIRSLALDDAFVAPLIAPPAPHVPSPAPAPALHLPPGALDGAFLDLCERVGVAPGPLRAALVEFLRRAEASGLSLQATRAQLEPRTATKSAKR